MTEGMQKVGTVTELASGKPLRATVDGEKVLVMLVEGSPVAIPARCPHAHGPLHQGNLRYCADLSLARLEFRSGDRRSEEHTSELQSLMRISYAVFCLKKKK